jgi:tRNA (uracil-5-)-methyltransferase
MLPAWPSVCPFCKLFVCVFAVQLDDVWQSAASALRAKLLKALGPEQCSELHIVGRSRKQKVMLDAEHVTERMEVAGKTYEYMQVSAVTVGAGIGCSCFC